MDEMTFFKVILATGLLAILAGVMGCFVIWRRMAYFSDSLSHSALLGVVLGLLLGIDISVTMIVICLVYGLLLMWLLHKDILTSDALLGIFAHSGLGIGLFLLAIMGEEADLHHYLLGDVMDVRWLHIVFIVLGGGVALSVVLMFWSRLVLMTLSPELGVAEGISLLKMRFLLVALLTVVVAISIQIIGVLLLTALLLIPAATARQWSYSPEMMAFFSSIIGALCAIVGSIIAMNFLTPPGPTIVVVLTCVFVCTYVVAIVAKRKI